MSFQKGLKWFADITYKHLTPNVGDMLLVTGTIGWILSSIAQVTAVVINNKIPKEQKKFLIPQEIADAAVNIASFFTITSFFKSRGKNLVNNYKIITPKIKAFINNPEISKKLGTFDLKEGVSKFLKKPKTFKEFYSIESEPAFQQNVDGIQDHFNKFRDGMDFTFGAIGAIISSNIVTPLLRNAIASEFQKYKEVPKPAIQEAEITKPILAFNNSTGSRVSLDDFRTKTGPTYPNAIVRSNSSMKI